MENKLLHDQSIKIPKILHVETREGESIPRLQGIRGENTGVLPYNNKLNSHELTGFSL